MSIDMNRARVFNIACLHVDQNGDGTIEKHEFEQARANNQDLNQSLINILQDIFEKNASSQVNFERAYFSLFLYV
jgi:Ca2+-binding EF-hand superfamily protein